MSEQASFVLEKCWVAKTGRAWKVDFERTVSDEHHIYFQFTCIRDREAGDQTIDAGEDAGPDGFIFTPQISISLLSDLGIDPIESPKLVMRVAAGQGLEDIKIRLNAGHDRNFNDMPYCKTYTRRDVEKFRKYLPRAK